MNSSNLYWRCRFCRLELLISLEEDQLVADKARDMVQAEYQARAKQREESQQGLFCRTLKDCVDNRNATLEDPTEVCSCSINLVYLLMAGIILATLLLVFGYYYLILKPRFI